MYGDDNRYYVGRLIADSAGIYLGVEGIVLGVGTEILGGALDLTGAGAPIGVQLNAAGIGIITGSATVVVNSGANFFQDAKDLFSNIEKGKAKSDNATKATEKASGAKGKLIGNLDGLTKEEINAVDILRSQGKNVEIILVDPKARIKTPDFKIDGVRTELKTLANPHTNTGMKRIQEAFKQNTNDVIINGIDAGLTKSQAEEILARAAGKYPNGKFPGKVEIWTKEGTIVPK